MKSEKVEGELYHRYWIDEAYLTELKEIGKQVNEGTFFENLLAGITKKHLIWENMMKQERVLDSQCVKRPCKVEQI